MDIRLHLPFSVNETTRMLRPGGGYVRLRLRPTQHRIHLGQCLGLAKVIGFSYAQSIERLNLWSNDHSVGLFLFHPRPDLPHRLLDRLFQRALGDALGTGHVDLQREAQPPLILICVNLR